MGYSSEKLDASTLAERACKPGTYSDGGGLRLTVRSLTSRSWVFSYQFNGAWRSIGLGSYPEITLAKARRQAAEVLRSVKAREDPHEVRALVRATQRAEAAKAMTFKRCAQTMHANRTHWGQNYTAQWLLTLSTYAFPVIGRVPVADIDTEHVLRILKPIWASRTQTAQQVRGWIEKVLDWAMARGYRSGRNPARWRGHLEHFLPACAAVQKVGRTVALSFDQMACFMTVLRAQKGVAARALEFMILTARQRSEINRMRWDEIDTDARIWTVPRERMNTGREHRVPLSTRAIEILEEMKTLNGFVFGAGRWQLGSAMFRLLSRLRDGATEEGFRSTFQKWATERGGFPRRVVQIALARTVRDQRVADTGDELIDKQRELMDAWAAAWSEQAVPPSSNPCLMR